MNAHAAFQLAALICGMVSFMVVALWRLTGTNQGASIKYQCQGAAGAAFALAVAFFFLSLAIK